MKKNIPVITLIVAVVIVLVGYVYYNQPPSIPQVAEFVGEPILTYTKFGATALQENDTATIRYNIMNISTEEIKNANVKTKTKSSEAGQYIEILKIEDKIPFPLGASVNGEGGTSGSRDIGIKAGKVPYDGKPVITLELYVNGQLQESKDVTVLVTQK